MPKSLTFQERIHLAIVVFIATVLSGLIFTVASRNLEANLQSPMPVLDRYVADAGAQIADEDSVVKLDQGSVFWSGLAGTLSVSFETPAFRVLGEANQSWISWDSKTQQGSIYALRHPVWVDLLSSDGRVLATVPVPEGRKMVVPLSKIQDRLSRLRLSKLQKEFPLQTFSANDLSSFVDSTQTQSNQAYQNFQLEEESRLRREAQAAPTGYFHDFWTFLEARLTLMPEARDLHTLERSQEALRVAMGAFLSGDRATGAEYLKQWSAHAEPSADLSLLYARLFYVLPGDALYELKEAAGALVAESDPNVVLQRSYAEVQDLLARGDVQQANAAFDTYQARFSDLIQSGFFNDETGRTRLSQYYELLFELLKGRPVLFSQSHFEFLLLVEREMLSGLRSKDDLDEVRQSFIQDKLALLQDLVAYGRDRKIPIDDAADMADQLLFSADEDLRAIASRTAILKFYEDELSRLSLTVDFMKTPEFFTYSDFDAGLAAYQQKVNDLQELNQYLAELKGGSADDAEAPSLADAIREMGTILSQNSIAYESVESMDDPGLRLFRVEGASLNGIPFEGRADRESHILYDLSVLGHDFQSGVLIEQLGLVIEELQKDNHFESEAVDAEPSTPEDFSLTDQVMQEQANALLKQANLQVKDWVWTVEDSALKTLRFEGSIDGVDGLVSGRLRLDTKRVDSIQVVLSDSSTVTVPSVTLDHLKSALVETLKLKL